MYSFNSISASDADLAIDSIDQMDSQVDDVIISDTEKSDHSSVGDLDSSNEDSVISEVDDGKFSTLQRKISELDEDETLYLNNDYINDDLDEGIIISKNIRIEGNGYKLNALGKSRIFTITDSKTVILNNITFMNGFSNDNGGAIIFDGLSNSIFTNLIFINNHAENHGGAIYVEGDCSFNNFTNVVLKNNTALRGGGIYFVGNIINNSLDFIASQNHVKDYSGAVFFVEGKALYNNLTGEYRDNHADHCAGVLYVKGDITGNTFDGYFENNTGLPETGGAITLMGTASNNTFKGSFYNNSARIGGALYFYLPSYNNTIVGQFINNSASKLGSAIYFRGIPYNLIANSSFIDNKAPAYLLNVTLNSGFIEVLFAGNNTVANAFAAPDIDNLIFNNVSYWGENGLVNSDDILPILANGSSGQDIVLEIYKDNKLVYRLSNITNQNGVALLNYPNLDPGNYKALIYHEDNSYYDYIEQSVNIAVPKIATKLSISNLKTTYNTGKYAIITLKDEKGNIVKNAKIVIELNGNKYTKTSDKNGQIKLTGLAPNTYKISASFNGNEIYEKSNLSSKITINKASSKIVAKGKSFKLLSSSKKYIVVLRNNKGKVMKNKKLTLRINGKTYASKTNSKGQATFKLDKFNKEGTFTAVIKFAGDKYYKKVSKKTKIKFTFKVIKKGSKDKSTVKKIQRALKKNGYYLSYKKHYLKVDGIYGACTVRSVKQFQKAKGLKVTGQVNYATAKKLKII